MNFQQFAPPDYLKKYVRYFWTLESIGHSHQVRHFRATADGCPGLVFQHRDKGQFLQGDNLLPETFLFGQSTRFLELALIGSFDAIGIYFEPHVLKSVFGFEAAALTNSCLNINEMAVKDGHHLSERLSETPHAKEKMDILCAYLFSQICRNSQDHAAMQFALGEILSSGGKMPLTQIQLKLQLSERTFERRFKEFTGISPKLFSRICRFQASLKQLQNNGYDKLSDIAFENNYADQSHFIRAFQEFAGFSPVQFQKLSTPVVENLSAIK